MYNAEGGEGGGVLTVLKGWCSLCTSKGDVHFTQVCKDSCGQSWSGRQISLTA